MVRSAEEWLQFNEAVMAEFRGDPEGEVASLGGLPLMILHTIGAVLDELPESQATAIISAHAATTPMLADYVASASGRAIPIFKMRMV